MNAKRIQMSRQRPWRADNPDAVIVARPSKWGNPFRVVRTECSLGGLCWAVALGQMVVQQHLDSDQRARELAVSFFRSWMDEDDHHDLPDPSELRGRDLACWCPPAHPCHADVLLELANGDSP